MSGNRKRRLLLLAFVFLLGLTLAPYQTPLVGCQSQPQLRPLIEHCGSFGNTHVPKEGLVNWPYFWQLFNAHSAWDLEYYDGIGWVSVKEDLQVIKNYTQEWKCKITLVFTASHATNYRLTFAIDLQIRSYIHKEAQYRYVLSYQDYDVTFDWSDVVAIPNIIISHGITNEYFWWRARRDNVPLGAHLVIDPSFGYDTIGEYSVSLLNYIRGSWFTCTEGGRARNITAYINVISSGKFRAAIYKRSDLSLVGQTNEKTLSTGISWRTFNYSYPYYPLLEATVDYILVVWGANYSTFYGDPGGMGAGRWRLYTYTGNFPDPMGGDTYTYKHSIYCNYTANYKYEFTFKGIYDEDAGTLKAPGQRAVNVTTYFMDGTPLETFEVNGTYELWTNSSIQYFFFDLTKDREYWLSTEEGVKTIYIFDTNLTTYYIGFNDLTGALGTYSWVSAWRYINGTLMVVEKRKADITKMVVMNLKQGQKYTLKVEATPGTVYTYGDVVFTSVTAVELTIKGIEFPQNIVLTYKYVHIYADRILGAGGIGNITITYEDLKELTAYVLITIKYNNGTVAYGPTNETTNSFIHTWTGAYNNTDYRVEAEINHGQFGILPERWYLPRSWSKAPWGLSILGTLPFDTSIIIPAIIIIMVGLIFSSLTVPIGCFLTTGIATLLNYMGWIAIDVRALVAAWVFSILVALILATRRISS